MRPKVIVSGCFDLLHAGHVWFLEQAAAYGDLYVSIGNDDNVRQLKGPGHPHFNQMERQYLIKSLRYVTEAVISEACGILDAVPLAERIRPAFWIVNEDGDRPEKRAYCLEQGVQYLVLTRSPGPGLPAHSSSELKLECGIACG